MLVKKEQVEGSEITLALSPLAFIKNFFGAIEREPEAIPLYSEGYRTFRKKIVSQGRALSWKSVTAGTVKEKAGLQRIAERRGRSAW